jgi:hypothetical protein
MNQSTQPLMEKVSTTLQDINSTEQCAYRNAGNDVTLQPKGFLLLIQGTILGRNTDITRTTH